MTRGLWLAISCLWTLAASDAFNWILHPSQNAFIPLNIILTPPTEIAFSRFHDISGLEYMICLDFNLKSNFLDRMRIWAFLQDSIWFLDLRDLQHSLYPDNLRWLAFPFWEPNLCFDSWVPFFPPLDPRFEAMGHFSLIWMTPLQALYLHIFLVISVI